MCDPFLVPLLKMQLCIINPILSQPFAVVSYNYQNILLSEINNLSRGMLCCFDSLLTGSESSPTGAKCSVGQWNCDPTRQSDSRKRIFKL